MDHSHHTSMPAHDYAAHERTYENFIRMGAITTACLLTVMVALAIGGTTGHWGVTTIIVIAGILASVAGAAVRSWSWKPAAGVVVFGLLLLLLLSH